MLKIFASVGSDHHEFSRFILLLNALVLINPLLCIKVQNGYTKQQGKNLDFLGFISNDEMNKNISEADVVISHAGAGIVTQAHNCGKLPIVVPRLVSLNEHTDESQPEFGAHMGALGLAKFHLTPTPIELYNDLLFVKGRRIIDSGHSSLESSLAALLNKFRSG
jgi:UDP-N-acetylglucosamine transferase subunit ALG13